MKRFSRKVKHGAIGLWLVLLSACSPVPVPSPTVITALPSPTPTAEPYLEARLQMVQTQIVDRAVKDEAVLAAMRRVPRHEFVPEDYRAQAYADHPLPIGYGQTISQPYIVAVMTELLALKAGDKVLEIGTGSGYQAAIAAEIVGAENVYTVEIIGPLQAAAAERLRRLGYAEVHVRHADGYYGWSEEAPFDAIIVTAAPDHVPQPLLQQLADGGRMVIPVGPPGSVQTLWRFAKEGGEIRAEQIMGVLFVPLTREVR